MAESKIKAALRELNIEQVVNQSKNRDRHFYPQVPGAMGLAGETAKTAG
jgi:hypothetical protein